MTLAACRSQIDRCGRCGACLEVCPVYAELRAEPYVARGKVFLLGAILDGKLELTPRVEELLGLCLLCQACTANCPSLVKVEDLILAAREELVAGKGLPLLKKNIFHHLLNSKGRLKAVAWLLYLYQQSGMQWFTRYSGFLNLLPGKAVAAEQQLPQITNPFSSRRVPRKIIPPQPRRKIIYFMGCLTSYVYPQIGQAVAKVLYHNDIETYTPDLPCCGVPALTAGDREGFNKLARQNIETINLMQAELILTDCATCGSTLRKYGDLLDTAAARKLSSKVRDISEFLANEGLQRRDLKSVPLRVTYHDPCHLKRAQGLAVQPRTVLRAIPELELVEMAGADRCCGSAGSFAIGHQELSERIVAHKIRSIQATEAQLVTTGCPSCLMQLERAIKSHGLATRVAHPIELVAQAYRD